MFAKDWKLIVLAPLAVSFLTGCSSKKDEDPPAPSPWTGVWINKNTARPYLQSLQMRRPDEFCQVVRRTPTNFGLSGNPHVRAALVLDAISIDRNGAVSRYTLSESRAHSIDYARALHLGHVAPNGNFTPAPNNDPNRSQVWARGGFDYEGGSEGRFSFNVTALIRDAKDEISTDESEHGGRGYKSYLRSTEPKMEHLAAEIMNCVEQPQPGATAHPGGQPTVMTPPPGGPPPGALVEGGNR